jgi:hypothetical protein
LTGNCAFSFGRGDLLGRTNIKIVRFYDGSITAKEVMSEAIAYKVKKILSDDIENKAERNII